MKKIVLVIVLIMLITSLYSCQFSEHGVIYDDQTRWTQIGDTYSFLGKYFNDQEISFKRFSGIYTLERVPSENDFIIVINSQISSGDFTCFLVTENDKIIELLEEENHISASGEKMRLRIVGKDAVGKMSYTITS